ncbi:DUF3089 domain-containing protein [Pontixanthobacter aquaemixtae]|uniref:DUF3089 domain-containing protein n=1 Tax=Pontixanthobacter aquaemixtae TaxID=1958940 RepID=A0A844ZQ96_9SPHN|nr:DUF3089 domain-containing protein [Pontixanthobacter aquaemixtae]MXO89714.1 DUF3089 domain-containing protein [Pontixanthobacter aquaemixtae]
MARKFLYFVAFVTVLFIVGAIALSIWWKEATEYTFVPRGEFVEQSPLEGNAYEDPEMWISRPGIGVTDPARWQPAVEGEARDISETGTDTPNFAVFFIHPTSYLATNFENVQWNAPLDDEKANARARLFVKGLASPFNQASEIWAPRYRQAATGAFLVTTPDSQKAIDAAYADVKQAFEYFIASVAEDTPVVLSGHSQGTLHLLRLLKDEVNGKPVQDRVAGIYAVGWPISIEHDLPALGFPACATADQTGCIVTWSSFAEPADPSDVLDYYRLSIGFDGQPRGDSKILCVNPISGIVDDTATADQNTGTLVPAPDFSTGELRVGQVPARCDDRGLLLIGDPPEMGNYVLDGQNYHVYDIPLFWKNLQQDVGRRVSAWTKAR